jgi:hypothetical protein
MVKIFQPKVVKAVGFSIDKEIVLVKDKLTELQQEISPFRIYIQKEVPMLENLLEYYRKSDGNTKKKIPGCIFAEKLVLRTKVATLSYMIL